MDEVAGAAVQTVVMDGSVFRCHIAGTDVDGQDPVVLLPGIGGSVPFDFDFLVPMLARHHRVLALDWSQPDAASERVGLEGRARVIRRVVDELVPNRNVKLVGYSLGAAIAVLLAAEAAVQASSLVLLAGWLRTTNRQRSFAALWRSLAETPLIADVVGRSAREEFAFLSASGSIPLSQAEDVQRTSPFPLGPVTDHHISLLSDLDLTAAVDRITIPTLVVAGTDDAIAPVGQSLGLFAALADARFAEVESGHAMMRERPAQVLSLVDGFLRESVRHPSGSMLPRALV